MDFRKLFKETCIGACLLCIAGSAHALTIEVNQLVGAWNNVIIGIPNTLAGVGTNQIEWGSPVNGGENSAFSFSNASGAAHEAESHFSLGEFTYLNNPVTGENPDSAKLVLDAVFKIGGTTVASNSIDIEFDLHQIPGKCGKPQCSRDLVKLKNTDGVGTFVVGGVTYTLNILGFMTDEGLRTVMHSFDDSESSAELVGVFTATAMPEPATLGLALLGFAVLVSNRRRTIRLRRQDC